MRIKNILDFKLDYNPFLKMVGKPRHLLWPVNAYRLTLPRISIDKNLNPFEQLIFDMLDQAGEKDIDRLSEETCLPKDLIQHIVLKLQDKGVIDQYLNGLNYKKDDRNIIYDSAIIFRELVKGKIIPYIFINNPLKKKNIEFKYRKIPRIQLEDKAPTPKEIIQLIGRLKKRSIIQGQGSDFRLPSEKDILIINNPEFFYLDCLIAVQDDGEFRIADPFYGFSIILEQGFNDLIKKDKKISQWFMDWQKNLFYYSIDDEKYKTIPKQRIYPNISLPLSDRIDEIYAALEWSFFYNCTQGEYDIAIKILKIHSQSEHPYVLNQAAERIGFKLSKYRFRPLPYGKIESFLKGKAEMEVLISISMLIAKDDINHPLYKIADLYPDCLDQILYIKKRRDKQSHGEERDRQPIEQVQKFVNQIIKLLLPELSDENNGSIQESKNLKVKSKINIQNEFGFHLFHRFDEELRDYLIQAEYSFLLNEENSIIFINDIYSLLQRSINIKIKKQKLETTDFIEEAKMKVGRLNLSLPVSLMKIKEIKIRETLMGINHTLGASLIALIISTKDEDLIEIKKLMPNFLDNIVKIIEYRGHGNEYIFLKEEKIKEIRDFTYSFIKILLEI